MKKLSDADLRTDSGYQERGELVIMGWKRPNQEKDLTSQWNCVSIRCRARWREATHPTGSCVQTLVSQFGKLWKSLDRGIRRLSWVGFEGYPVCSSRLALYLLVSSSSSSSYYHRPTSPNQCVFSSVVRKGNLHFMNKVMSNTMPDPEPDTEVNQGPV